MLVLLTDAPYAQRGYGTDHPEDIHTTTPDELAADHFAAMTGRSAALGALAAIAHVRPW
jgi:hypothetical protein